MAVYLVAAIALLGGASSSPLSIPGSSISQTPITEAERGWVSSAELQALVDPQNLVRRAKELYGIAERAIDEYGHPTRVIGSKGHLGTIDYIYDTITSLGDYYHVYTQDFPAVTGKVYRSRLVLGSDVPKSAEPMQLTPPTRSREPVYGPVVLVNNFGCDRGDFPSNVTGAIAFISRGVCPFGTKSELAGQAGAVAAVVYNNEKGPFGGTLGEPSPYHVATFGISSRDAAPYLEKLKNGSDLDAIAFIDSTVRTITTTNVIAQTVDGDPDNCVMLGAHSDSVEAGPGINDDGSGTLSLLEVATHLANFRVNNCVRFAWWGGEEEGLLGSNYYVETLPAEENLKIRMFMDYDMMAGPNFAYQIYNATNAANPVGSEELRDLYVDFYESHGLGYTFIPFDGRSDYDAFIKNGIPGGGIATGAEVIKTPEEEELFGGKAGIPFDPCYHQLCDGVDNLNVTAWEVSTKLIAHSVATYAESLDGFPKRTSLETTSVEDRPSKYLGHALQM